MRNLLIIVITTFLFSCKGFQEVQVTGVEGLKVNKISVEGIDADLMLRLKNPNPLGFSLYKSEFEIKYSGIHLGTARLDKKVRIKANAEETYGFKLSSDFKNINVVDVLKLLNISNFKNTIEVKGNLNAGKFLLRKKIPVDIKEKLSFQ